MQLKSFSNSINSNRKNKYFSNHNKQQSFKSAGSTAFKICDSYLKVKENLSYARFAQDTATNWAPKAICARSKADFAEMSFLEFLESAIFYFLPGIVGEKVLRKSLTKNQSKEFIKNSAKSVSDIINNKAIKKTGDDKKLLPLKAGILIGCACVPAAEYALSFAKNLFTLKVFKTADFDNIANLDKNHKNVEDDAHKKLVEKHSKRAIFASAAVSAISVATGVALAKNGHKSEFLQKLSKTILEPGTAISDKLGIKSKKVSNFLKNYLNLDFIGHENGSLELSKGLLGTTAITGLFGYYNAAKDRGELDKKEVLTRVPIVVLYTIFGSALFDNCFKKILLKKNFNPDLLKKDVDGIIKVPARESLPAIAEKIAKRNSSNVNDELKKLTKDKAFLSFVPGVFSLAVMGFSLSVINRAWTQYRYNKSHKNDKTDRNIASRADVRTPAVFKGFVNKLN